MAAWLFASIQSVNDPAGFGEYQQLAGTTLGRPAASRFMTVR